MRLRWVLVMFVVLFALLLGLTGVAAADESDGVATACTVLTVAVVSLGFRLLASGGRRDAVHPRPDVENGVRRHSPERGRIP